MPATTAPRSAARWLTLILAVICVIAGGAIFYLASTVGQHNRQLGSLKEENRKLAEQLRSARDAAAPQVTPPDSPAPAPASGGRRANRENAESRGEDETQPLRDSLAEANATVARLEVRISELESQLEKVTAESKQSAAAAEGLTQNLAEATRTVESLQKETKNQVRRLAELETANTRLREDTAKNAGSAAQVLQLSSELQDLNRRRDTYVSNILRRYKDIADQYRALSVALDGRRDRQSAPLGEAEVARIQNAIALTEEDLRQINALNAQASRILKKAPAR